MGNSPLRASHESEQQTLVLNGIQVILLVRLEALVSNRPSALGLPSLQYNPFSWALVRLSAWITAGECKNDTYSELALM
jgi:hypothetical protein